MCFFRKNEQPRFFSFIFRCMGNEIFENHYEYFLAQNEREKNALFCRILWLCCLVGPAIALGVFFGAFPDVTFGACLQTLLVTLAFAIGHTVLYRFKPESPVIKYIGLIGTLVTIYTMCVENIGVYLTYFFVPLVSLLYCSRKTFVTMSILSYIMLLLSNWQIAEYSAGLRVDIDAVPWFIGRVGGETIEFLVMFAGGWVIDGVMNRYLRTMYVNEVSLSKTEREAYTDQLTGLWNRRYIDLAFDKYVVVQHNAGALLVVDMDHMKFVNDSYGHLEGDRALKILADRMRKVFASSVSATICRFGGDEFVVLLPCIQTVADLTPYISQLISSVDEAFSFDEKLNAINISVGAAFINDLDMSYQTVFERADKALYDVKNSGRNSYQIYMDM